MKEKATALAVVSLFTILQFLVLYLYGYTPYPDCIGYIGLAEECVRQHSPYPTIGQINDWLFIWNVGAINAVALSLRIFGSVWPLLALYSVMKGATAWCLYSITRKIVNPKAALIALALYVAYPANYGEATSVLSEVPFVFFTLMGLWLVLQHKRVCGGFLMALANWFRPVGLVFLLSTCIYLIYNKQKDAKKGILRLLSGYVLFIAIVGSLSWVRTGHFIYQSTTGWTMLMKYSWDNDKDQEPDRALFENGDPMACPSHLDCLQKDSLYRRRFLTWLKHNPGEYFRQMPEKLGRTYVSDNANFCTYVPGKAEKEYMYEEISMAALWKSFPRFSPVQTLTFINLLYYYALMACFAMAVGYFIRHNRPSFFWLSLSVILLGTAMLLLVGHGESRYHIPFMPFVILTVAAYIEHIHQKKRTL